MSLDIEKGAEIVLGLLSLAAKLEPAVADIFRSAHARGELPDSLRAAAEKLDPADVLAPYQKRIDAMPVGP